MLEKNSITSDDVGEHETFELTLDQDAQGNLVVGATQHASIEAYNQAQTKGEANNRLSVPQVLAAPRESNVFPKKTLEDNENTFSESDRVEKVFGVKGEDMKAPVLGESAHEDHSDVSEGVRSLKPEFQGGNFKSIVRVDEEAEQVEEKGIDNEEAERTCRSPKKSIPGVRRSVVKMFESDIERFNHIIDNPEEEKKHRISVRKSLPMFIEDVVRVRPALRSPQEDEEEASRKTASIKKQVDENIEQLVKNSLEAFQKQFEEEVINQSEEKEEVPAAKAVPQTIKTSTPEKKAKKVQFGETEVLGTPMGQQATQPRHVQFDPTSKSPQPSTKFRKTSGNIRQGSSSNAPDVPEGDKIRRLFEGLPVGEQHRLEIEYKNQVMVAMNSLLAKRQFSKGTETTQLLKEKMRQMVKADFLYYCSQLTFEDVVRIARLQRFFRDRLLRQIQEKIRFSNMHLAKLKTDALNRRTVLMRMSNLDPSMARQSRF
jgi:hypothetical protein